MADQLWKPMQWRGSDDGVVWTRWRPLLFEQEKVPMFAYYQARIFILGKWEVSPVTRNVIA